MLKSLPKRELISGWAEAIKHGLILNANLVDAFENNRKEIINNSINGMRAANQEFNDVEGFITYGDKKVPINRPTAFAA